MLKFFNQLSMPLPTYLKRSSQLAISCVAALYITFHGRPLNFGEAILCWDFYSAFLPSFGVAYVMVWIVQYFTIWLDQIVLWTEKFWPRFVLQIVLGVILPSLLDMFVFYVIFASTGRANIFGDFLLIDYPMVVSFVIFMNMVFVVLFYMHQHKRALEVIASDIPVKIESDESSIEKVEQEQGETLLSVEYYGRLYELDVRKDIIMFATVNKQVRVFTMANKSYPISLSLTSLREKYSFLNFYQISRGVIINMSLVSSYQTGEKRDTLELILDENKLKLIPNATYLIVTKDNIPSIESFFRK